MQSALKMRMLGAAKNQLLSSFVYIAYVGNTALRVRVCDRYVAKLEGESPLRALVRRTVREGKGVYREVESEESRIQNAGLTNRKRI